MQFSYAAIAAALVASVAAGNGTAVYVTDVVTAYTTYCPEATQLTYGGVTYTITEATTLTITNCPCTISKLATITPVVYCSTCSVAPVYVNTTAPAVVAATTPAAAATTVAVGTVSAVATTAAATFTGAANRAVAGSAAGLAGLLGLAAYIL